jgi:hypothetical protein
MKKVTRQTAVVVLIALLVTTTAAAADPTPGYNQKIPAEIMTPAEVTTRIGRLRFFDGMPDAATTKRVYDNLDFLRGVEVFLDFIPATSIEAIKRGSTELGVTECNQCLILDKLLDSNPLFLTGNTDTVYASVMLDLERDGATVIEIPPKCGPGTVNDAFFRFVTDMGVVGPDRGAGGKYLILPPDNEGDLEPPEGSSQTEIDGEKYFVFKSPSYTNWLILRGFLVDGKPTAATKMFEQGLKVYPLARKADPPAMEFISGSDKVFNTIHANNFQFYHELAEVLAKEPVDFLDPELRGLAASLGIRKGKPFEPDPRMQKILTEAVAVGNATARALFLRPRDPSAYLYENSGWCTPFIGGDYRWLIDGGEGGRNLDARTFFFYCATVNTPAMAAKMVGKGSQYALNAIDKQGDYLDGGRTYKLHIPKDVPAKDFWSVVVYDPQTRSQLQTQQPFPSKNNKRDNLATNADGSVDLYFGPQPPAGKERNWIETVPNKGWFALLRLYGPLDPWFERTWRPGEFERVE